MRILSPDSIFSAAQALYWYCAEWHNGQRSDEYGILSRIGYRPGTLESGPTDPEAEAVYQALREGRVLPERLEYWIRRALRG